MFKRMMIALPLSFFIFVCHDMARAADENGLLFIDGPSGTDMNVLIERKSRAQTTRKKRCAHLKRDYMKTKRRSLLTRYKNCKNSGR